MRNYLLLVILALGLSKTNTTLASDLKIATAGKSSYVIVTPAKPTPEEATAADWLATALQQVTGARLPIHTEDAPHLPPHRMLVGDTAFARKHSINSAQLKPEEWRITSIGHSLILAGGRPRGTIYAVSEFLERELGVVYLDPFTEVITPHSTLSFPAIDRHGQPAFPVRSLFSGFPYGHPANGGPVSEKFAIANKNTNNGRVTSGDYARMIPTGVHTFGHFISSKEFAATHPEYFAMDATGKRLTDDMGNQSAWTQLCVTNEDVRRIVIERSKKFILDERATAEKEQREPSRVLVLSQNDNTSNLCLCPQCKAITDREGSESGPQLEFINHVARALNDEFPEITVMTEAYNFTLQAPRTLTPEPNVMVRFIDNYGFSDLTKPLVDPRNERSMNLFRGWQAKNCQLGVWDYWRVFQQHPSGSFAPSINVRAIHSDMKLFRDSGVKLMTIEAEDVFGGGIVSEPTSADMQSFFPLRTWVGMKLMDNPDQDLNPLLDTFFRGYYGPAAKPMRALYERIEDHQTEIPIRVVDVQRHVWMEAMCNTAFMVDAYRWLDEAMAATASDPFQQTHVQRERIIIDSVFLWLEEHLRQSDPVQAVSLPARAEVLRRHRQDWHDFIHTVFDPDGLKQAEPIIEIGVQLAEKLKQEDTAYEHVALQISESDIQLDGQMTETFWQQASTSRMLPRDPRKPNDDPTSIRLAWTDKALYVGIEQPADKASATFSVTLMAADRAGLQLTLILPQNNGPQAVNPYFYKYDANGGIVAVNDQKSQSKSWGTKSNTTSTTELEFLWSDLAESVTPDLQGHAKRDFLLDIESYPAADSKTATHSSSPWLIGTQPSWHSGYYKPLHLKSITD